jgi:hypothetical protein
MALRSTPRWNNPAFGEASRSASDPTPDELFDMEQDYVSLHSNFVNFFEEITIVNEAITYHYAGIARAISLLQFAKNEEQEVARIVCLFYIAFIFKHAQRTDYDLSWLDKSLAMTEHIWKDSMGTLRWMLLQGMGRGPRVPESLARTEKLAELASLLQESSWRRLEDRYCALLLDGSPNGIENAPWNSNFFADSDDT